MAKLVDPLTLFFSLVGGIIPAVLWLWFWLREDNRHPEPAFMIIRTFLAGVLSIVPTYFLESYVANQISDAATILMIWALIEEVMKFSAGYLAALRTKYFDEPIDGPIYLITAALGFSAAENFLFIVNSQDTMSSLMTGGMRFVGASLLHTLASAIIGCFLAIAFRRGYFARICAVILGLLTSTVLHTSFNIFIIKSDGGNISIVFLTLWVAIIALLLFFEKLRVEDTYN